MSPRQQPDAATSAAAAAQRRDHRVLSLARPQGCARRWTLRLAAVVAVFVVATLPAHAAAAVEERCAGPGVRADRISIQLFNFIVYVMGDFEQPNAPSVQRARTAEVLRRLSGMGYRNVEPFSFEMPFASGGLDATAFRALLDHNGLAAPSAHVDVTPATFNRTLADARILGLRAVGSGGWPPPGDDGFGSYDEVLQTAAALNRLGASSVRNGTGKVFGHNHHEEFRTRYVDPASGQRKTVWELLIAHTDPRYVTFQLDVLWAADAGADPVALLRRHGDRIGLLHVKDGVGIAASDDATPVALGEGELDLPPILRAAANHVQLYVYEQDPPFDDLSYDPFPDAEKSLRYLRCVAF